MSPWKYYENTEAQFYLNIYLFNKKYTLPYHNIQQHYVQKSFKRYYYVITNYQYTTN